MSIEDLSRERQEILRKLSEFSNDDLKALDKLIEKNEDILRVLKKEEAWRMVLAAVKTGALWISVVLGALYMGFDKFTAFIKGLV